jgi:RNA polymerase sigma-70 factor, ECF subfamily
VSEGRDITQLLIAAQNGDAQAAADVLPLVYEELHRRAAAMMRRESSDHTLQPTALVHEAYLRLIDQDRVDWRARTHFFAVASQMMRRVLVDHARGRMRDKRGGSDCVKIALEEGLGLSTERDADVLALNEALEELGKVDPRQAEIVVMRFFGGLTVEEVAAALDVSKRTVEGEWTMAKAWLRRSMLGG